MFLIFCYLYYKLLTKNGEYQWCIASFTPKLISTWYFLVQLGIRRFFGLLITNMKFELRSYIDRGLNSQIQDGGSNMTSTEYKVMWM